MKRLLLVSDDLSGSRSLVEVLQAEGFEVHLRTATTLGADQVDRIAFDLVLCDVPLSTPVFNGLIPRLRARTRVPLVVLGERTEASERIKVLRSGADAYLSKPLVAEEVLAIVDALLRQAERLQPSRRLVPRLAVGLTPREQRVLQFVAEGKLNKEIARALTLSHRTIETHVGNILNKTGFNNRTELARWAIDNRIA
jgi:DNA-binding NarL/FixJ family response regulator